ncbi:MAG: hypothetical protein ACRD2A_10690, partial [Vicinamibacterales bacterium]
AERRKIVRIHFKVSVYRIDFARLPENELGRCRIPLDVHGAMAWAAWISATAAAVSPYSWKRTILPFRTSSTCAQLNSTARPVALTRAPDDVEVAHSRFLSCLNGGQITP